MRKAPELVTGRPFHQTIIDAIRRCPGPSTGEILRLFQLIKDTQILMGHDEICAAIDEYFYFPGANKWAREIRLVKESLRAQQEQAGKKAPIAKRKTRVATSSSAK